MRAVDRLILRDGGFAASSELVSLSHLRCRK
jgi:hypothetical protein